MSPRDSTAFRRPGIHLTFTRRPTAEQRSAFQQVVAEILNDRRMTKLVASFAGSRPANGHNSTAPPTSQRSNLQQKQSFRFCFSVSVPRDQFSSKGTAYWGEETKCCCCRSAQRKCRKRNDMSIGHCYSRCPRGQRVLCKRSIGQRKEKQRRVQVRTGADNRPLRRCY